MRMWVFGLLLVGCASNPTGQEPEEFDAGEVSRRPIPKVDAAVPEFDAGLEDSDACVHRKVYVSQLGSVRLDPNCPPELVFDPIWIPPWDPGPIEANPSINR